MLSKEGPAPMNTRSNPAEPQGGASSRLLRIEDVAERLAVSRSMAWKIISSGDLPSVRIGRAVRVRPADLEGYVAGAIREG